MQQSCYSNLLQLNVECANVSVYVFSRVVYNVWRRNRILSAWPQAREKMVQCNSCSFFAPLALVYRRLEFMGDFALGRGVRQAHVCLLRIGILSACRRSGPLRSGCCAAGSGGALWKYDMRAGVWNARFACVPQRTYKRFQRPQCAFEVLLMVSFPLRPWRMA
jgi:hypothetical protein